jgi:hypothetical protein
VILLSLRFPPFLEGDLYVVVRLDGNKVAILIAVPQPHRPARNSIVGKPAHFRIDSINERLVSYVEGYY